LLAFLEALKLCRMKPERPPSKQRRHAQTANCFATIRNNSAGGLNLPNNETEPHSSLSDVFARVATGHPSLTWLDVRLNRSVIARDVNVHGNERLPLIRVND